MGQPQQDAPDTPDSTPAFRFGDLAVALGLLTRTQVSDALLLQQREDRQGAPHRRLGEILQANASLTPRNLQKVLLEQQRRREKQEAIRLPKSLGEYTIEALVGRGGMASVYRGRDRQTGKIVALKWLSARLGGDPEFIERFKREVRTAATLTHPNIVTGLGAGLQEGRPFLVMEYVEGRSLGRILNEGGHLDQAQALAIARDVAAGLAHAHTFGIVHRDVKPDNVLLDAQGRAKLTDFGLAKLLQDNQQLTQSGIAIGTPHYISPEQISANRYIDHRADLYSLGALLFCMLTGQVPYDGQTSNDVMLKHLQEPLRDPRELAPWILPETAQVVVKLMAKKSAERYDSADQLIEDLDRLLRGQAPVHALLPSPSPAKLKLGCGSLLIFLILLFGIGCGV